MKKKSIKADIQTLSVTDDPQSFYEIQTGNNNPTYEDVLAMQEALTHMEGDYAVGDAFTTKVPDGVAYQIKPLVWKNTEGVVTDPVDYLMENRGVVIDYFGFDVELSSGNDVEVDGQHCVGMCGSTVDRIVKKIVREQVFGWLDKKIIRIMTELFEQQ